MLALVPTPTVPKLILVGDAESCPVVVVEDPVPLSGTVNVGLVGSLLTILILPVALPTVVGEKVTTAWADCPALIVVGVVIPLIVNAAPVTVIMDTVRSAVPLFVSVRFDVAFKPSDRVPKLILVGLTANCGWL